ncbi:MAG: bifunctional phosphoribosylaminoimidazolecarboxamide formyltransferase/IMP cyclohydrolase [Candidatus Latescibacter sp.]|nr:bifunctional phosphoribosylaminoimidazolecarboxamide formyltransferase/IMP cyclohydrolase [Candidatus Latescibacter sp.]
MEQKIGIGNALISVSDKTGVVEFARALSEMGVRIISTGGTARSLKEAGVAVTPIDQVTGFPEILDGRVKTLHPKVHGGLLAVRDSEEHLRQLRENGIDFIDLVAVNLYPFEKTVAREDVSLEEAIENIDIGGPTMLRSAAKNCRYVAAVCDPVDYEPVIAELKAEGRLSDRTRQYLAAKVFRHTADYDAAIDTFLSQHFLGENVLRLKYTKGVELRYGENWHQKAKFFLDESLPYPNLGTAEQIWGKQLSYNNYIDLTAAIMAVKDFSPLPAVSVIKHTNPCGLATGRTIGAALKAAWDGDRISAFGSVIACTGVFDGEAAEFLKGRMVESIIAPDFTEEAREALGRKKNIMLLKLDIPAIGSPETPVYRQVLGGMLRQNPDRELFARWESVTVKAFPDSMGKLAEFSMIACKNTKSNAIVLCEEYEPGYCHVLGMGAGQPNRVDSLRKLAAAKARENLEHAYDETKPGGDREEWIRSGMASAVLASDAFFPFDDTVREAAAIGIRFIVQPGGSSKDDEVIAAADELGVSMVFTGMRHFLH